VKQNRILIVDDSVTITTVLASRLEKFNFEIVVAHDFETASQIVAHDQNFFLAVLDLNLPDAANGEIVDYMLSKGIPSVVMTGNYRDEQRAYYSSKPIIDYVLKDSPWSLEYIVSLAKRIYDNQDITILIVDDSSTIRSTYHMLLDIHNYNAIEAENGAVALKLLEEHGNSVKLVLTDYNMPVMDGFELIPKIREKFSKEDLSIIGLSASDRSVSAKFLKLGANDFLSKSFIKEEFYARVMQNIDSLKLMQRLRDIAMKDHLTNLFNRHYFFDEAKKIINSAKKKKLKVFVAMIDIDFFKKINDRYGHQVGDAVLVDFSRRIDNYISSKSGQTVVARFGGEEFIALSTDYPDSCDFVDTFENLRKDTEDIPVRCGNDDVFYTISTGLALANEEKDLDAMVKSADDSLYVAKENGRNRVVIN